MPNWSLLLPTVLLVACSYEGQGDKSLPVAGAGQVEQVDQVIQSEQNAELTGAMLSAKQLGASPADGVQRVSLKTNLGPENMCDGAITHNERVHIPPVAKPPFGKYYKDPAFGSRVIRITDSPTGVVQKPPYSTMQAWNADESLMLLYRGGTKGAYHRLLDGHTYKPVKKLDIVPSDLEEVY